MFNEINNSGMFANVYDPDGIQGNAFDYNNLINKPVIHPAQIQSDWSEQDSTKKSFIRHKPQLFDGNYNNLTNKPTIPQNVSELNNDLEFINFDSVSILDIVNITGTSYDMNVRQDVGKLVAFNSSSKVTVNIGATDVQIPYGSQVSFCNRGTGDLEIKWSNGETVKGPTLLTFDSIFTVVRVTNSVYIIFGDSLDIRSSITEDE